MRVLIPDVYISRDGVSGVLEGYVYVEGSRIAYAGGGPVRFEHEEAELVGGCRGCLVLPAPVLGPVLLEAYPYRGLEDPLERVEGLSGEEAYHAMLMGLYELSLHGVAGVLVETHNPLEAARALRDSGLYGAVLVRVGCARASRSVEVLREAVSQLEGWQSVVRVGAYACSPSAAREARRYVELVVCEGEDWEGLRVVEKGLAVVVVDSGGRVVSVGPRMMSVSNPWLLALEAGGGEAFKALGAGGHELLGVDGGVVEAGRVADLVVLDLGEPPCWLPDASSYSPAYLASSRPRVSLLLSRGQPVVDSDVHVYLGPEAAQRARRLLAG